MGDVVGLILASPDGHDGSTAAEFAITTIISKLFEADLKSEYATAKVKDYLKRIIMQTDEEFSHEESIHSALEARRELRNQLPSDDMDIYTIHRQFPQLAKELELAEAELCTSASIVLALVYQSRLFVATCGSCRAVLGQIVGNTEIKSEQLSSNHTLTSDDERVRILMLGVDPDELADLRFTRCVGNPGLKESFSRVPAYSKAISCPVIAEPEVMVKDDFGSDFQGFLLLFSKGLDQVVRDSGVLRFDSDESDDDVKISEAVDNLLCYYVAQEMTQHADMSSVAQAVVDRVGGGRRSGW